MRKKTIIESTIILTVASLITRLIGFFYRIYMNNELGAYNMGLYQMIMPLYTFAWALICSGFTTTISKLASEYASTSDIKSQKKVLYYGTFLSFLLSVFVSFIFITFSKELSLSFLDDESYYFSIILISTSFPFMAVGSCIRGYFLGLYHPEVTSTSQVIEQLSRIGIIYLFVNFSGVLTINIAILGIVFAEGISCFYSIYKYITYNSHSKAYNKSISKALGHRRKFILNAVLVSAIPLSLNRVTHSLLHTYENLLITDSLVKYGYTREIAIEEFGKISGLTFPLIYFPTAIILSISTSLLANISSLKARNNYIRINDLLYKVFNFTLILSFLFVSFFMSFANEIGDLLYNTNISVYLVCFGATSPFLYMHMILSGVMNGLGNQLRLFANSLLSSFVSLFLIYTLTPKISVFGFVIGFSICVALNTCLNYFIIKRELKLNISIVKLTYKPLIACIITILAINTFKLSVTVALNFFTFGLFSVLLFTIYVLLLFAFGLFNLDDIAKVISMIKSKGANEQKLF
ncbi:MAG: oligosaccharide flippase family protein [Lachnospirales bacterium]